MGEYLHELNKEDEESPSEVPDIPTEETDFGSTDFGSTEEEPVFGSTEEEPAFGSEETNFNSEDITFDSGETTFETSDSTFGSEETNFNTEETTDFGSTEEPSTEDPFAIEDTTPFSEPEPISDPEPIYVQEPEPEPEYTPELVAKAPEHVYKSPENFEDLKKFAESTSITGMGAEGNPSFSVLLKNIRYIEDVNDILALMKELGLLSDPEEQIRQRLMRGHLLVPRISEYAAIFLAHKLRRFDIDIQVGLSDEIHPPKHQETPETGLVSKYTLYQNQTHHFHFDDPKLEISQIIVAATPNLEGHQVIRYLGVASEHKMLDGHIVEDEDSAEIPRYYSELALKLKAHALKANANAVIGLNYQLTPLPSEYGMAGSKYRLSCTGNLVWVNKL